MGRNRLRRQRPHGSCGDRGEAPTLTRFAQPPAELARTIDKVARSFVWPPILPALLVDIWRRESGGNFPNPYVNSSGYGGLFGTRNWNASTYDQTLTAATILAKQIDAHGGDLSAALRAYSGGGYSTLPHSSEAQALISSVAAQRGGTPSKAAGAPIVAAPGIGGALEAGAEGGAAGSAAGRLRGGAAGAAAGAAGLAAGAVDTAAFLGAALWLVDRSRWLRITEFLAGAILMLLSLRGLFLVLASRDTPIDYQDVGSAARSIRDRQVRPVVDQLVPGAATRRRARRKRRERSAADRERDRRYGKVPF